MITVIIPALNEETTIGSVVKFCLASQHVSEVIVIDDNSEDDTVSQAKNAGARIIHSQPRGKGISMKDGVRAAQNDLIVFLDADIDPYPEGTIEKLSSPLIDNEADFVKGAFARNAGRVTELVAKPLLHILFPGLVNFSQPLSGMVAGRKSFFKKIEFVNDYGVDIGILIDMYLMKARVKEVHIGYIENKSKPWEALGKMSKEVSRAIISKTQGPLTSDLSEEMVYSLETIHREMNKVLKEQLSGFHKMIVFDMDQTIFKGRFIDACAQKFGFTPQLADLRFSEKDPIILTKRIGNLLKNKTMDQLLDVVAEMELVEDIRQVIEEFKKKKYITGIISNSYTLVTNYVMKHIGADFSLAQQLEFSEGRVSGEVNLPSYFFGSPESICGHSFCKTNALQYACEKYNVLLKNCIVVGDGPEDRCMVGHAGKGIAFCSSDELLQKMAYRSIKEKRFSSILEMTE